MNTTARRTSLESFRLSKSRRDLDAVIERLAPPRGDLTREQCLRKLARAVNEHSRQAAPRPKIDDAITLVRRNVADLGSYMSTVLVMLDFLSALAARHHQLKEQEKTFWQVRHRAPDYFARAIALRLAKLYANETQERPTIGTSSETGDPSTGFSRAVGKTFALLGIETGARRPAEWAVQQLTDEDFKPIQRDALAGPYDALINRMMPSPSLHNRLAEIGDSESSDK